MLRWMTPSPPACAIAIARAPSVTVSIAAEIERDAEFDLAGDAGSRIGLAGQNARCGWDEHHVVEGQRLADFHPTRAMMLFAGHDLNM